MYIVTVLFLVPPVLTVCVVAYVLCVSTGDIARMTRPQFLTSIFQLFLLLLLIVCWSAVVVSHHISIANGGFTDLGYAADGVYVLRNHSIETSVSEQTWESMRRMEYWCTKVGLYAMIGAGALMILVDRFARSQGWSSCSGCQGETASGSG